MVMALVDEEFIVFFDHDVLAMADPGLSNLVHKLIVELRSLADQLVLRFVANAHLDIEKPLQKEDGDKPSDADEAQVDVHSEEENDGHDYGEGSLDC
jgi:hypothetical protein